MEDTLFTKMVDNLVLFCDNDPELEDGMKWLDKEAWKRGIDLYEMVYIVMARHDTRNRAKEWLRDK